MQIVIKAKRKSLFFSSRRRVHLRQWQEFERRAEMPAIGFAEARTYFPTYSGSDFGAERYLNLARRAKDAIGLPVISSLNGVSDVGGVDCAHGMQEAGADAIELNIYLIPADLAIGSREVEQHYLDVLAAVKAEVSIQVAVRIGPYFSAIGAMAQSLAESSPDALVLSNRLYQPDIDLAKLRLLRSYSARLSHRARAITRVTPLTIEHSATMAQLATVLLALRVPDSPAV